MTKQLLDRPIINEKPDSVNLNNEVQKYLPGAKILLVKGYSSGNTDYTKAKAPVSTGWGLNAKNGHTTFETYIPPTENEVNNHIRNRGWIGAALDQNYCVVDIDGIKDKTKNEIMNGHAIGKMLFTLLKEERYKFHLIQTPNGFQFIFKSPSDVTIKNRVKEVTALGVQPDYRTAGGMIVFPTSTTEARSIVHTADGELDEVPYFLQTLYKPSFNKEDVPNFPIFPFEEGGRNDSMNKFLFSMRAFGGENVTPVMVEKIGHLVNTYFTNPPMDSSEVDATIQSVLGAGLEVRQPYEKFEIHLDDGTGSEVAEQVKVPVPYFQENGLLKKMVEKGSGDNKIEVPIMICRQFPIISQSFSNVEKSQLHHEIQWDSNGRIYRETVPAGDVATRSKILLLADKSLAVTDNNARELIQYFDRFILFNDLPVGKLVERLGHVKGGFVHPLMSDGIKILPPDVGDQQTVDAFKSVGTADEWIKEVFERIRVYPKAVLMVLASFTSVILKDLKLSPFIIDMSGPTSKGKSTVSRIAASVWGTNKLVGEWNITRVAAERKAAFLNSFPLILDDTQKADPRHLKSFIYNFSGGRSKGRGSLTGTQTEYTWNNLMISNGETSLVDFATEAGGAAARVLPITGLPFDDAEYTFFNEIYEAMEDNHGAIGIEFLEQWKERKELLIPNYKNFNEHFQKKSNGNEVLSRIARHYSALMFTADCLNKMFNMDVNLNDLTDLFDEMVRENTAIDKPMQMLELVLSDLDSDRLAIYGEYIPRGGAIKAIYRDNTIILLPSYLKEFLKTENLAIRKEWLRRGISVPHMKRGKETDSGQYKHCGENYMGVAIYPSVVEELGYDFTTQKERYAY
ncbi:DUF927 domain-containing protein [Sporosarcina sp. FA9]|uniref:DUF927 domain-containing protein n=1 Tax=Sporosarcina sp. FA9 TaxID=3413030 RepID=UPI003F65FC69